MEVIMNMMGREYDKQHLRIIRDLQYVHKIQTKKIYMKCNLLCLAFT